MTTAQTESYPVQTSQDLAQQRLAASRQDVLLYAHLLQASLVVERENPLRNIMSEHPYLVRTTAATLVIMLSTIGGLLAPQIAEALHLF
jgi:hypothetical protein